MTIQTNERITTDRDVNLNAVSPGFFPTLGIKISRDETSTNATHAPAGENGRALGDCQRGFCQAIPGRAQPARMRICQGSGPDAKPNIEIVGVVADFSYRGLREESEQAYFPIF